MSSLPRRTDAQSARRATVEGDVLAAVERLLGQGSAYADLSVDRIAREAGISRTAFYFYFADKRELLMRLTQETTDRLYLEAETWWGGEGDGAERLTQALRAVVDVYREHAVLLGAVVEVSTYDEEVATFWRAVVARFVDATRERIEAEQRGGLDPAATAFALAWMTERTMYQQFRRPSSLADEALVEALVQVWTRTVYG